MEKEEHKYKKWIYLIPVLGFVLMMIEPYETDDGVFALAWFFIHAFLTTPVPALIFMHFA